MCGVGHVRAGHADEVELAFRDGVARGRDVGDARGVEHGHPVASRTAPAKSRCGALRMPCTGDHVGQARIGVDMPADDVEEIDHAGVAQTCGNLQPLFRADTLRRGLVGGIAETNDELRPDALAHRA